MKENTRISIFFRLTIKFILFFKLSSASAWLCSGVESLNANELNASHKQFDSDSHLLPPPEIDTKDTKDTYWHSKQDGTWVFELNLNDTWAIYSNTPAAKLWASRLIDLKFSNNSTKEAGTLSRGSRYYFDIRAGGPCRVPMGLEITSIKDKESIELQYLAFSPARGKQWINFEPLTSTRTRVTHVTKYRGKNRAIDIIYPLFHREAVRRLHKRALAISKKR